MPLYDYKCEACGEQFEARHGFDDPAPACANCGSGQVHRVITRVPRVAKGMAADLGANASKEQLRDKWAEETPKLREQLVSKLGEETVNRYASTLNTDYDA
jgi:putative FmdB family regulatory protein